MRHITRIEQVLVPGWTYFWPRCECGWDGDIVRHRGLADDQRDEHHDEVVQQPTLFD